MNPHPSPIKEAVRLRAKADGLTGDEQAYCLWQAREWEKAAEKFERVPGAQDPRSDRHRA